MGRRTPDRHCVTPRSDDELVEGEQRLKFVNLTNYGLASVGAKVIEVNTFLNFGSTASAVYLLSYGSWLVVCSDRRTLCTLSSDKSPGSRD